MYSSCFFNSNTIVEKYLKDSFYFPEFNKFLFKFSVAILKKKSSSYLWRRIMISLLLSSSSAAAAPSSSPPSSSSLAVLGSLLESSRVHLHPWIYTVSPLNISHMSTQALQGTIPQPQRRPPPLVQLRNPQIQFKFKWYVCGIGFQGTTYRGNRGPYCDAWLAGWLAGWRNSMSVQNGTNWRQWFYSPLPIYLQEAAAVVVGASPPCILRGRHLLFLALCAKTLNKDTTINRRLWLFERTMHRKGNSCSA